MSHVIPVLDVMLSDEVQAKLHALYEDAKHDTPAQFRARVEAMFAEGKPQRAPRRK